MKCRADGIPDATPISLATELSSLHFSFSEPLVPAFDSSLFRYQAELSLLQSATTVTATSVDPTASIEVNGIILSSGVPSEFIDLDLGANELTVTVLAGEASRSYVIAINRGAKIIEQSAYAKASNTDSLDRFASVVAFSGDTLVVATGDEGSSATGLDGDENNNDALNSGAVYVFRKSGNNWIQEAYLKASNTGGGDKFGSSVALDGDTLAVGAVGERSSSTGVNGDQLNDDNVNSGAVYVFQRTGSTWAQEAYIKASVSDIGDSFGASVSLEDDRLVVGAPFEDSNSTGSNGNPSNNTIDASGAIYVFRRDSSGWAQEAYIKASNPGELDQFGGSVALYGDTLVSGAVGENSAATDINGDQNNTMAGFSGAAYVFRRVGSTWQQEAYLKASNTDPMDNFGYRVSIYENTIAIGANLESSNAMGVNGEQGNNESQSSGAVYVFQRNGSLWAQQAYVKASNSGLFDTFGGSLALGRNTMVVGSPKENSSGIGINSPPTIENSNNSGAAYLFKRVAGGWVEEAYIKPSNTGIDDKFGFSVALSENTMVIGSRLEDSSATGVGGDQDNDNTTNSGAVYLFE